MTTPGNSIVFEQVSLPATARQSAAETVTRTQLLRERRRAALTVQLFAEPASIHPGQLPPPSQLRLIALLSGVMQMRVRSQQRELNYVSQPGTVKITSPNCLPYELEWESLTDSPVRTVHLYLPPDLLPRTAEAAGLNPAHVELAEGCAIPDALLNQLTVALGRSTAEDTMPELLFADSAVQVLAAQLLRQHCVFQHELPSSRGPLPPESLRQVRDYVQAHLAESIRLEELAALVHLSPYHFSRVFKRTTGFSPYQYVIEQRLTRAVELLHDSKLNVTEVAAAVGYSSAAHLSQLLLRRTGRQPSSYLTTRRA